MKTIGPESTVSQLSMYQSVSITSPHHPIKPKVSRLDHHFRQKIRNKRRELHKQVLVPAKVSQQEASNTQEVDHKKARSKPKSKHFDKLASLVSNASVHLLSQTSVCSGLVKSENTKKGGKVERKQTEGVYIKSSTNHFPLVRPPLTQHKMFNKSQTNQ